MSLDEAAIRALPKVVLHDHLDGGLRPATVLEIADEVGHELPVSGADRTAEGLARWVRESADSGSLERYLEHVDALAVGVAAWRLGAGRARKEDPVQAGAGVELHVRPGDRVSAGQPLMTLHTDTPERFARAQESLAGAWRISDAAPAQREVVLDRITAREA